MSYRIQARRKLGGIRRSTVIRWLERSLRSRGKRLLIIGDTNGTLFAPGWETVDMLENADHVRDLRQESLPYNDESVDAVYSSHMVEHIAMEHTARMFREVFRCLKPGGYFRLVTPDMDILLDRYGENDAEYFRRADENNKLVEAGILPQDALLLHNRLLSWFASYPVGAPLAVHLANCTVGPQR